jgi:hypothetical protein
MTIEKTIYRDLGDGLILRCGRVEDTEELAAFNAFIFRNRDTGELQERLGWWTRDLALHHPTVKASDFTVVEDTKTSKIVSSFCWISQHWTYDGIPFGVGRPEMVGTHPDYRGRGLVRAQFELAHEWSAQRGELIQVITGIPFFYRQFGYEMTMQLGAGRSGFQSTTPKLKKDETEPYVLRPATVNDLPFMREMYAIRAKRQMVDCIRDDTLLRYELDGKAVDDVTRFEFRIITTPQGEPVGLLLHPPRLWGANMAVQVYELKPDISWLAVSPSVMRYLWATGNTYYEQELAKMKEEDRPKKDRMSQITFEVGLSHPVYDAMRFHLPQEHRPYNWYIRVPDVIGFLRHITPALEHRLQKSVVVGHTGELKLSFYRTGIRMVLEQGNIKSIEPWQPTPDDEGSASFPDHTFLHLVFGNNTMDELRAMRPDLWAAGNANHVVLDALFPKRHSDVWPIS